MALLQVKSHLAWIWHCSFLQYSEDQEYFEQIVVQLHNNLFFLLKERFSWKLVDTWEIQSTQSSSFLKLLSYFALHEKAQLITWLQSCNFKTRNFCLRKLQQHPLLPENSGKIAPPPVKLRENCLKSHNFTKLLQNGMVAHPKVKVSWFHFYFLPPFLVLINDHNSAHM